MCNVCPQVASVLWGAPLYFPQFGPALPLYPRPDVLTSADFLPWGFNFNFPIYR